MLIKLKLIVTALFASVLVSGCETASIQTTSGSEYLSRYSAAYTEGGAGPDGVDADVRRIAAVEPDLRFPARIGLARIEKGRLSAVPQGEAETWMETAQNLGSGYGEFVPVSPLVAEMVSPSRTHATQAREAVADIRRGAARQHLDYVLVYEVAANSARESNLLAIADLTLIGAFVLPSRNVKVRSAASAVLLDVRNGYPYGTASATASDSALARPVASYDVELNLGRDAHRAAVTALAPKIEAMMQRLKAEADEA